MTETSKPSLFDQLMESDSQLLGCVLLPLVILADLGFFSLPIIRDWDFSTGIREFTESINSDL